MKKTFTNPETHKEWWIEIDGNTIRTCLKNGKVKETLCDNDFKTNSKASSEMMSKLAFRTEKKGYVVVDLNTAEKIQIKNNGFHPFFSPVNNRYKLLTKQEKSLFKKVSVIIYSIF